MSQLIFGNCMIILLLISGAWTILHIDRITVGRSAGARDVIVQYVNLTLSSDEVVLEAPANCSFYLLQVHSFSTATTLSYARTVRRTNSVHGRNIGLYQANGADIDRFYLLNDIDNARILFAITAYPHQAPIPGGCSMEFNTSIAPYQDVAYNEQLVKQTIQAPSLTGQMCEATRNLSLEFYHLPSHTAPHTESTYYEAIASMLTPAYVRRRATRTIQTSDVPKLQAWYNNYACIPSVYNAIATNGPIGAAYVPAISYGCDITQTSPMLVTWVLVAINLCFVVALILGKHGWALLLITLGYGLTSTNIDSYPIFGITLLILLCACIFPDRLRNHAMRIYLALIFVAITTIHLGYFQVEQQMMAKGVASEWLFWLILASLVLLAAVIPMHPHVPLWFTYLLHLHLVVDYFFGYSLVLYINVNTVRRAMVPHFRSVSQHTSASLMFKSLPYSLMVECVIYLYWLSNSRTNANQERQPLLAS